MAKKSRKRSTSKAAPKRPTRAVDPATRLTASGGVAWMELRQIGAIFALALTVRLVFFFVNRGSNPLFYHPILDSLFHHEWAGRIIDGNFWGDEVFFRAPLYPYVLALLYKVSGSSITLAVLVQHVTGSTSRSVPLNAFGL